MKILIKKIDGLTQVLGGDKVVFTGDRCDAKRFANSLSIETGLPIYNEKDSGKIVFVATKVKASDL